MLPFLTLHVALQLDLVVELYSVLHTQHIPKSRFVLQHVEKSLEGDPRLKLRQIPMTVKLHIININDKYVCMHIR